MKNNVSKNEAESLEAVHTHTHTHTHTINLKETKGITLIALVITIIVLLILAGVALATLSGDNGILTRASEAKEETRGGIVQEEKEIWKYKKSITEYSTSTEGEKIETLEEILNRLVAQGQLTEPEKQEVKKQEKLQ